MNDPRENRSETASRFAMWQASMREDRRGFLSSSLFFVFCTLPKKKFSTCARCDSIG